MAETKSENNARMKKMGKEMGEYRKKVAKAHPTWSSKTIAKEAGAMYKKKHRKK
jgi:hypothetical protein